jgi:hypothetical protein
MNRQPTAATVAQRFVQWLAESCESSHINIEQMTDDLAWVMVLAGPIVDIREAGHDLPVRALEQIEAEFRPRWSGRRKHARLVRELAESAGK